MKNREKYREKILEWAVAPGRDICDFRRKEVLAYFGKGCGGISCSWCSILLNLWLDEEYIEPEVDWSNVPVDTLVRVRDNLNEDWKLAFFKGFYPHEEFMFATWKNAETSKTGYDYEVWKYCELVEDEDNGCN